MPDLFKVGREVYVKGKLVDGTFVATPDSLVTKCPSKYAQAGEAASAMVTRCSRDASSAKGN